MRILMPTWDFPPRGTGGTAAHVDGLARGLAAAGHDVVVLTIADARADHQSERSGPIRVVRAGVDLPWLPPEENLARTASANHALVRIGATVDRVTGGWQPDIVHGHDWRVGWACDDLATILDVPFVLSMHGTERVRHGGHLPPGPATDISAVEWWLAFRADRLIASTRFMVEQLVTGFELPDDRVVRIPNGVDPVVWYGDGSRPPTMSLHVVSWGRVQYEKGFQVLARAMNLVRARVPTVRCTIAGSGGYLPELQTQIDVEGVSDLVELPGFLPDDELQRLARSAGCIAIPSLYEPFGIVALEALAAGAPLIVAHTGGLAELLDGTGAGLTFEPGNPGALADCIEVALTDTELAGELRRHARRLIEERYTWAAVAAATASVYESVIEERGGYQS